MEVFIEPIGRLINQFSKLPGVGKRLRNGMRIRSSG